MACANGVLSSIIVTLPILQLAVKYNMNHWLAAALLFISISVSNAIMTTLEYKIYLMCKHISDKNYASACAKEAIDDAKLEQYSPTAPSLQTT